MRGLKHEEDTLQEQLADGSMSPDEYDKAMDELQRDCRDAAQDAAMDYYRDELEAW